MTKRTLTLITGLAVIVAANTSIQGRQDATLSAATRQKLVASLGKGAAYLHQQQQPDGKFDNHPGITAMAATALLRQPGARDKELATVGKTLDYLQVAGEAGRRHLREDDSALHHRGRRCMALAAGGRPQDKPLIEKARRYLAEHLLDEGEGVQKNDSSYGGMGYGGTQPTAAAPTSSASSTRCAR